MKTRPSLLLAIPLLTGLLSFSHSASAQNIIRYDVPDKTISWRIGVGSHNGETWIIWKKGLSGGANNDSNCRYQKIGTSYDLFARETTIRGGNERDEIYVVTGNEQFRLCGKSMGPIISRSSSVQGIKIEGWGGDDIIMAGDKVWSIKGGYGNDLIVGTGESQYISGESGNDQIFVAPDVWSSANRVYGSYDRDLVCFFPGGVPDPKVGILQGNHGNDTLVGARPVQASSGFETKLLSSTSCFYLALAVAGAITNGSNDGDQ